MALILSNGNIRELVLSGNIDDYPEGIILPVDKPYRWTSADVIRKLKFCACRHFHKKNLKVGHAGTLDPLATGVLLVCIGKATRLAEELQRHEKEYIAGLTFGATTPSYDLEKDIDMKYPVDGVSEESLRGVLPDFVGEQEQVAPLFSAKSVDGVRAYELARKEWKRMKAEGPEADGAGFDHSATEANSGSTLRRWNCCGSALTDCRRTAWKWNRSCLRPRMRTEASTSATAGSMSLTTAPCICLMLTSAWHVPKAPISGHWQGIWARRSGQARIWTACAGQGPEVSASRMH